MCMSHVSHVHESCLTCAWVMSHMCMGHGYIYVSVTCDMTHRYVPQNNFAINIYNPCPNLSPHISFTKISFLSSVTEKKGRALCTMTHSHVWHHSLICVTWLIHMCDMIHWYVWHDSFTCDMNHWCVWHDSFACVTWRIDMCDKTKSHVLHLLIHLLIHLLTCPPQKFSFLHSVTGKKGRAPCRPYLYSHV